MEDTYSNSIVPSDSKENPFLGGVNLLVLPCDVDSLNAEQLYKIFTLAKKNTMG